MAKFFADRMFLEVNGFEQADVENLDYTVNPNLTRVETMTRNLRSAGFRKGNKAISATVQLAVPIDAPALDLSLKGPEAKLNVVAILGGDRYSFIDGEQGEQSATANVGTATKTLNLEFLDFVNENGQSKISELGLG